MNVRCGPVAVAYLAIVDRQLCGFSGNMWSEC